MAKQGRKTPYAIENFIVETKRNSPGLTYQQIADRVEARFGSRIDKSTIGRVLQRYPQECPQDVDNITVPLQPVAQEPAASPSLEIPKELLKEVKSLMGLVKLKPRESLAPSGRLEEKVRQLLRRYTRDTGLPALLDEHSSALGPYGQSRNRVLAQMRAQLEQMLPILPEGLTIESWDEHVLETLEQRVWGAASVQEIPQEHRRYEKGATPEGGQQFTPMWGGRSLSQTHVTDEQYEVIVGMHREFCSFAERFLPVLWEAAAWPGNREVVG